MDTKEALKKCVAHWERLHSANDLQEFLDEGYHGDSCELCKIFTSQKNCGDCPIAVRTGIGECIQTPWPVIDRIATSNRYLGITRMKLLKEPVENMYQLLCSLEKEYK